MKFKRFADGSWQRTVACNGSVMVLEYVVKGYMGEGKSGSYYDVYCSKGSYSDKVIPMRFVADSDEALDVAAKYFGQTLARMGE